MLDVEKSVGKAGSEAEQEKRGETEESLRRKKEMLSINAMNIKDVLLRKGVELEMQNNTAVKATPKEAPTPKGQ